MSDGESGPTAQGCPLCDWDGRIAETNTHTHQFYTHVTIEDGTLITHGQCSERIRERIGLLSKIKGFVNV